MDSSAAEAGLDALFGDEDVAGADTAAAAAVNVQTAHQQRRRVVAPSPIDLQTLATEEPLPSARSADASTYQDMMLGTAMYAKRRRDLHAAPGPTSKRARTASAGVPQAVVQEIEAEKAHRQRLAQHSKGKSLAESFGIALPAAAAASAPTPPSALAGSVRAPQLARVRQAAARDAGVDVCSFSGFRITHRQTSATDMANAMVAYNYLPLGRALDTGAGVMMKTSPTALIGVLLSNRSGISKSNKPYATMTLCDLHGTEVRLALFGAAASPELIDARPGTVIVAFGVQYDAPRTSGAGSFKVFQRSAARILGQCPDFGRCTASAGRNGSPCTQAVNTRESGGFCFKHRHQKLTDMSRARQMMARTPSMMMSRSSGGKAAAVAPGSITDALRTHGASEYARRTRDAQVAAAARPRVRESAVETQLKQRDTAEALAKLPVSAGRHGHGARYLTATASKRAERPASLPARTSAPRFNGAAGQAGDRTRRLAGAMPGGKGTIASAAQVSAMHLLRQARQSASAAPSPEDQEHSERHAHIVARSSTVGSTRGRALSSAIGLFDAAAPATKAARDSKQAIARAVPSAKAMAMMKQSGAVPAGEQQQLLSRETSAQAAEAAQRQQHRDAADALRRRQAQAKAKLGGKLSAPNPNDPRCMQQLGNTASRSTQHAAKRLRDATAKNNGQSLVGLARSFAMVVDEEKTLAMKGSMADSLEQINSAEAEAQMELQLENLEAKDAALLALDQVTEEQVKCWYCSQCHRHTEVAAARCEQQHRQMLEKVRVTKRYFQCGQCRNRTSTLASKVCTTPCSKCSARSWNPCSKLRRELIAGGEKMLARGEEHGKFLHSM